VPGLVPSHRVLGSSHLTPNQLIMHLSERLTLHLQVGRKLDEIIDELVNKNDSTEPTSDSCLKYCVPSTDEELSQLFHAMSLAGTQPAVLSIVDPYSDNYVPKSSQSVFPKPLKSLHDMSYMQLEYWRYVILFHWSSQLKCHS